MQLAVVLGKIGSGPLTSKSGIRYSLSEMVQMLLGRALETNPKSKYKTAQESNDGNPYAWRLDAQA